MVTRRRSEIFNRLFSGATFALVPLALTLLADFPGRRACAIREAQFGRPAWEFFVGGLVGDVAGVMPPFAAVLIGIWIARSLLNARRRADPSPSSPQERGWRVVTVAGLALATVVFWLVSEGASEFKIQRGLYPTYYETKTGLADASFVWGSLPTLLLDRYLWPTLIASIGVGGVLWWYLRRERVIRPISWLPTLGLVGGCLCAIGLGGVGLVFNERFFPSVGHRRELYPPLVTLYKGLVTQKKTAVFRGLRAVFLGAHFDDARAKDGARELGYSDAQAQSVLAPASDCAHHPLARPTSLGGDEASSSPLLTGLTGLSRQLFAGRTDSITVWQIAIESFRADDIAGLNPQAAREIAPFTSSIYDGARGAPAPNDLAFRRAYQGGMRTSQAVSALMCGLGALPFNMALLRDLGYVPVRCLPDVLADAGFETRVFYGADMSFDNMLEFFRYHGARTTEKVDFPRGLPTGTWDCITDDPLFEYAFAESIKDEAPQYNFVLTLAGHTPFGRPSDLPLEVERRVNEAAKKAAAQVTADDLARLYTLSYTDWALERFVRRLDESAQASRSILVVSADHSTGDPFLWSSGWSPQATAGIPFFIHFPQAFLDKNGSGAASRQRLAALNDVAQRAPISANDSPSLLLALLGASPQMAGLPAAWRWSTVGGQASSRDFHFAARGQSLVWGINADAEVFSVDAEGADPVDTHERSESFGDASQVTHLGPALDPAAALLSAFLNGYGSKCTGPENIRKSGGVARAVRP